MTARTLLALILFIAIAYAEEKPKAAEKTGQKGPSTTRHKLTIAGKQMEYVAAVGYLNLAELYANLGQLGASAEAAAEAVALARKGGNKQDEMTSLAYAAWTAHQRLSPARKERRIHFGLRTAVTSPSCRMVNSRGFP